MRYIRKVEAIGGRHYVWDSEKQEAVWSGEDAAQVAKVAAYLELLHARNPERETVPAEVAQRIRLFAAVCDVEGVEYEDKAIAAEKRGDLPSMSEHSRKAARLRQRSRDLFLLMKAAGVPLSD